MAGGVPPAPPDPEVAGEPSIFLALLIAIIVLYVAYRLFRILWRERPGGPEDNGGWNWWQWRGPRDWPKLPPTPKGSGPTPDYIPDEWVWEELGRPPRLTKVLPPRDEV